MAKKIVTVQNGGRGSPNFCVIKLNAIMSFGIKNFIDFLFFDFYDPFQYTGIAVQFLWLYRLIFSKHLFSWKLLSFSV